MSEVSLTILQGAVKGLLYPSEQDRPVKAVFWPSADVAGATLDGTLVQRHAKGGGDAKASAQSVSDFFAPVTTEQSWQSEAEKAAVRQFQALQMLLLSLSGLTVFSIGDTDQQVYVLGKTAGGDVAGIATVIVAT